MARTKHSIGSVFASLLAPVADALHAETGRRFTTADFSRTARTLIAAGLRWLAGKVEVKVVPVPATASTVAAPQQQPAPAVVAEVVAPVVVEPAAPKATRKAKTAPKAQVMPVAARKTAPTKRKAAKPTGAKAKPAKAAARTTSKASGKAKPKARAK